MGRYGSEWVGNRGKKIKIGKKLWRMKVHNMPTVKGVHPLFLGGAVYGSSVDYQCVTYVLVR
jgi:hypothetical protein